MISIKNVVMDILIKNDATSINETEYDEIMEKMYKKFTEDERLAVDKIFIVLCDMSFHAIIKEKDEWLEQRRDKLRYEAYCDELPENQEEED